MSGYFMEALEGRRSSPRSDTSYLVSLFPTTERASAAFAEQRYYWDALTSHGGSVELPLRDGAYGDPDHEGLYAVRLPTDGSLAELLFARGPILVEVFQQVHAAHPSHTEVRAFYDIGTRLDIIARSRTWYPEVRDDPWRSAASCLCDDTAGGMRKQAPTCGR